MILESNMKQHFLVFFFGQKQQQETYRNWRLKHWSDIADEPCMQPAIGGRNETDSEQSFKNKRQQERSFGDFAVLADLPHITGASLAEFLNAFSHARSRLMDRATEAHRDG